jgi:hypothetical protein
MLPRSEDCCLLLLPRWCGFSEEIFGTNLLRGWVASYLVQPVSCHSHLQYVDLGVFSYPELAAAESLQHCAAP